MSYQDYLFQANFLDGATLTTDASNPTDVVNLRTLQAQLAGRANVKDAVETASTVNIDLATGGLLVVDGYTLSDGDRVLVKDQTDTTQNGIYVASAGTWSRATDADEDGEVITGMSVYVKQSAATVGHGYLYVMNAMDPVVIGTDPITFVLQMEVAGTADQVSTDASGWSKLSGSDAQAALDSADTAISTLHSNADSVIGAGTDATDLGAFTGSTITDNSSIKTALQELESAVETNSTGRYEQNAYTNVAGQWDLVTHNLNEEYLSSVSFFDELNMNQNLNGAVLWRPFPEDPFNVIEVYASQAKTMTVVCRK